MNRRIIDPIAQARVQHLFLDTVFSGVLATSSVLDAAGYNNFAIAHTDDGGRGAYIAITVAEGVLAIVDAAAAGNGFANASQCEELKEEYEDWRDEQRDHPKTQ